MRRLAIALIALSLSPLPTLALEDTLGTFVAIGGGVEDPEITKTIMGMAGGSSVRVVVLPTASTDPVASGTAYRRYFDQLGTGQVSILPIPDRQSANSLDPVKEIGRADLLYFTGGDQSRLVNVLSNTAVHGGLQAAWQRRAILSGTSAGAMVWGSEFIANGTSQGALRYGFSRDPNGVPGLELRPGLGVWENFIVDTHFSEQHRLGRLALAAASSPAATGVGIDERTAAVVTPDTIRAVGAGGISVLEFDKATVNNAQQAGPNTPFTLADARLHRLVPGRTYLRKWRTIEDPQPLSPAKADPSQPPFVVLTGSDVPRRDGPIADFVRASGGNQARILVLAGEGTTLGQKLWKTHLLKLGAAQVVALPSLELSNQGLTLALQYATGIFLLEDAKGSLLQKLLANENQLAQVLGTYAQRIPLAAAGTAVRIVGAHAMFGSFGAPDYLSLPGLKLVPQLVADKAFWSDQTPERLIRMAVVGNRGLAVGLSPDNGVTLSAGQATVSGNSQVIFLDAREVTHAALPPEGSPKPASVADLRLSIVPPTGSYDLVTRRARH